MNNIINNLQGKDPVTIVALILAIIVICGIGYLIVKYGTKPFRAKKHEDNLIKFSVFEDLKRKGIIRDVTKKDIRLEKRRLRKLHSGYRLTKNKNKIEKKVTESNID